MQNKCGITIRKEIKMWYANKRTYVFDITQHCLEIILLISKQNTIIKQTSSNKKRNINAQKNLRIQTQTNSQYKIQQNICK